MIQCVKLVGKENFNSILNVSNSGRVSLYLFFFLKNTVSLLLCWLAS